MDDLAELIRALEFYPALLTRVRRMLTEEELSRCGAGQVVGLPEGGPDAHHLARLAAAHYYVQPGPGGGVGI